MSIIYVMINLNRLQSIFIMLIFRREMMNMKLKKFIAPLMAASLVAGTMPLTNVSAASDPRIYVDLTYEDGNDNVKANIMFENMPNVKNGGFHIEVGDGWNLVMDTPDYPEDPLVDTINSPAWQKMSSLVVKKDGDNDLFIAFGSSSPSGKNLNGLFLSFYLEKDEDFNSNNSEVNVVFKPGNANVYDYIKGKNGDIITSETDHSPVMLESREYLVGDVNNDGRVNAMDCTDILAALEDNHRSSFVVKDIEHTYKSIFPDAVCPASPDASQDGIITKLDADIVLKYYADMSTDEINNSRVGKLDFYEFFNN